MLPLSACGGFVFLCPIVLNGIVTLAGLDGGKDDRKRAKGLRYTLEYSACPTCLGQGEGSCSQLAMIIIINQVIHKYSIKQDPGLHKQQQIL